MADIQDIIAVASSSANGRLDLNVFDKDSNSKLPPLIPVERFFSIKEDHEHIPLKLSAEDEAIKNEINTLMCRIFLARKVGSCVETRVWWFLYHHLLPARYRLDLGHFGILCQRWRTHGMQCMC